MSNDETVTEIITQLQNLQIQQAVLLTRLARISDNGRTSTNNNNDNAAGTDPPTPNNEDRELAIGDRVRIRNPGVFQQNRGTIIKIGTSRITVLTRNGTKVVRAPKNLIFENE
jgi:hypothetical protein